MNEGSWQPDPTHRHEFRWWDGQAWTDYVSDQGATSVDPATYVATEPTTPAPGGWGAPAPTPAPGFGAAPVPSPSNDDTVHRSTAIQPPPVGSVLPESLTPQFTNDHPAEASKPRTGLIVAAVAGVLAIGVIAFLVLSGGDDGKTSGGTDPTGITNTTEVTGSSDTTASSEVAPTTVEITTTLGPTTTVGPSAADLLLASLPTAADVPASWVLTDSTSTQPEPAAGPGIGYCGSDNVVARAQAFASEAQVHGPTFELENGMFMIDAYTFPDTDVASSFLSASGGFLNACAAPVVFQQPESQIDLLSDGTGDAAVWSLTETGNAAFEETSAVDERLGVVLNTAAATTADTGVAYSLTFTDQVRYERTGNIVVVYTLRGYHTYAGGDPEWAFNPQSADILANIDVVRPFIVAKLAENGLL